jgi:hypothetical protein
MRNALGVWRIGNDLYLELATMETTLRMTWIVQAVLEGDPAAPTRSVKRTLATLLYNIFFIA